MMRFQTAIASVLGSALVVPVFLGQGQLASLEDALAGTRRALEVLKDLERRLQEEPAAALGLLYSATERPTLEGQSLDQRHDALRNEVSLLQMELDAMQNPGMAASGEPIPALPLAPSGSSPQAGITTGLDDSLRALLSGAPGSPAPRTILRSEPGERGSAPAPENAYSADPLRHGIACYRAGRFAEAFALLEPLDDGAALYWRARTLERLERLDEAVAAMERALSKGGEGFEQRRAQTDLEFLRWKRDFMKSLPSKKGLEAPR